MGSVSPLTNMYPFGRQEGFTMGTSFIVGKIRIKLWLLARAISRDLDLKGRQERRAVKLSLRFILKENKKEKR